MSSFYAFQIKLTADTRGSRAETLNYFKVRYGNTSTGVDTECGIGPNMDPVATSISAAPSFALYCDDPPIVRHLAVDPSPSTQKDQFYLCEVRLYAEKVGK